jgi:hypothetical protein
MTDLSIQLTQILDNPIDDGTSTSALILSKKTGLEVFSNVCSRDPHPHVVEKREEIFLKVPCALIALVWVTVQST